ncbi:TonB-dependent receptor [Sphingomonas xinjiangensis]|uniref:TonB-dependent receptor n=1 Tax=Sphingomonas xinjiangensis TaxID=643568 RepID=A0A840YQC2_9SPHN|nr:TonB-dependent receptor [Sphingomonas xinjiangensis]MBB5710313.1 TonB-dependent receptor [Sphingomonas xinjiangensis]
MRTTPLFLYASSIALVAGLATPALAQQADAAAPAPASAEPAADTAAPTDAVQTEEIVVTGLRRSLQSAQNLKRNSDQIVDGIVAEDIGKLPDVTASAALARVTGVQVTRGAGEAAGVQIRGLPDISTTYNGREIFTAENRNVAIQDFPAGIVQALEVYKSGTANLIEGGVGGQVNVRSRRPFDFDGFELSGSLNGVHFEQSQKLSWNGNLLLSNRWDTGIGEIGVLVNAAMTTLDFLDSTREVDRFVTPEPGQTGTPNGLSATRPNGQGIFYGSGHRWRPSVNGTIQWKPAANLEIYVDGLFQGYRAEDRNLWQFSPTGGDNAQYSNVVLRPDGTSVQSMTVTGANAPDGYNAFTKAKTDTYQLAGGFIWSNDSLRVTGDVAYTDSTYSERNANIDYAFTSSPVRNVNFDIGEGPGGGVFEYLNFNPADPANYRLRGLFDRAYEAQGDDVQARLDATYQTGISFIDRVDIGVRYNDRNASRRNGSRYDALSPLNVPFSALPVEIGQYPRGFRFDDYQRQTQFPGATFDSVFANIRDLRAIAQRLPGSQFTNLDDPAFNETETFTANEKAYAGYAQLHYTFEAGVPIDGLIGVRGVRTKTMVNGNSFDIATGAYTPVSQANEYTDWLPNASLRARLTDKLQLRLAYTQTRTRPSFADLNPSTTVGTPPSACTDFGVDDVNCRVTFTSGNPNLRPLQSDNYDVSLEWYFSRSGSLTGSVFRRDVSNFIFRNDTIQEIANAPDIITNQPTNAGSGRIQGAEASFTSFLDIESLPSWARGFGIQANYTYIDAGTELQPDFRDNRPGQQAFPGVSKHAFNLVGMYERPGFSSRLAYNWRSDFVIDYNNFQSDFVSPTKQDAYGTLDFSATVTPVENVTIAFDMLNILGTPVKTYREYNAAGSTYPFQVRYIERVYSLGARFRF